MSKIKEDVMSTMIDRPAPRRRVEARGATYSLEEFCKLHHLKPTIAKHIMTNDLKLSVITDSVLLSEYSKHVHA